MIDWEDKTEWLEKLPHRSQVMFAVFCAKQERTSWKWQVVGLWEDEGDEEIALATIERWLEGTATQEECDRAAHVYITESLGNAITSNHLYKVAYADDAASDAVIHAMNVVTYGGNEGYGNEVVLSVLVRAADNAVHCLFDETNQHAVATLKEEQMQYLRTLYLETLPEEQRNSWLVQACL